MSEEKFELTEEAEGQIFGDIYAARVQSASELIKIMADLDREVHQELYVEGLEIMRQLRKTFKTAPIAEPRVIPGGRFPSGKL